MLIVDMVKDANGRGVCIHTVLYCRVPKGGNERKIVMAEVGKRARRMSDTVLDVISVVGACATPKLGMHLRAKLFSGIET